MMNCDPSSHTVKRGILTINMKTSEQIKQVSLKVLKRNIQYRITEVSEKTS